MVRRNKGGLGGHKTGSWPSADSSTPHAAHLHHAGEEMKPHHKVRHSQRHVQRHSAPGQIR